jgi:hypothetical protein
VGARAAGLRTSCLLVSWYSHSVLSRPALIDATLFFSVSGVCPGGVCPEEPQCSRQRTNTAGGMSLPVLIESHPSVHCLPGSRAVSGPLPASYLPTPLALQSPHTHTFLMALS